MSDKKYSPREVIALCRQNQVRAIDLRFADFQGQQRHFTIPAERLTEARFEDGFGFDGSSIPGWKAIHESDMLVVPDPSSAFIDPFLTQTMAILCHVKDPVTHQSYPRDPREIARKAEAYMLSTSVADQITIGADVDFFVFDGIAFDQREHESYYHIHSSDGQWTRGDNPQSGTGQQIAYQSGYQALPPFDQHQHLRTEIMLALQETGIQIASQHREVASGGQCEIALQPSSLLHACDWLLRLKYFTRNLARQQGKVATFMPKPLFNDNGSGLHLQLQLWKDNEPLFAGSGYGGLSEVAMFAMGGILKHARSLLAFCCPTTNSYKRLIAGFDAPVNLSYSYRNRSAAVRIPANSGDESRRRLEFRCPDSSCNPYLANAAILMAMLDGVQNRIGPGKPLDKDLYDLAPEEQAGVARTPASLSEALRALNEDHDYLLRGDVFTVDVIEKWVEHKLTAEVEAIRMRPHPHEFALYFDC